MTHQTLKAWKVLETVFSHLKARKRENGLIMSILHPGNWQLTRSRYPSIVRHQGFAIAILYYYLYNNQINARALIGQSAVVYCAGKPTEKSRVF